MKMLRLAIALAATTWAAALIHADEKAEAPASKKANCCAKAEHDGKACSHECCVAAAKDGKNCEKCGGAGKIAPKH